MTLSSETISANGDRQAWESEVLRRALETDPERKAEFGTGSGLPLERVYTGRDLAAQGFDEARDLGYPGAYPFTRGVTPTMYRSKLWVMGQYSGFGSAEEANRRYRMLLEQGQTGFSIALDLPTQIGYDADHPLAVGEVGKVGVHLGSLEDVERLFEGIALEKVRQIRTTANAISPIAVALFVAAFRKRGLAPKDVRIFIQNDPLKEYIGRGTYIYPPDPSVKLSADVIEYCARYLPTWVPLAMSGYHIRDSGSTAVQELAFTFADALAYVQETLRRGLSIDDFAPQLYTFLSGSIDFLEEVAKFRAARRFWARLMRERFGAQKPESMKLAIFAYTLGGNLTAQQPLNNIARVAIETLAAVLGGVQTIATTSFDEAYSIPTEEAVTVALRTQQIVGYEAGVTGTVDPLAGSYAVESLTTQIERGVEDYIQKIDALGGAVACIRQGYFQRELSEAAYRYQKSVEDKERIVVGWNAFQSDEVEKIPVFKVDPEIEKRQVRRLQALRARRNAERVAETLAGVVASARAGENVIPACIEAVEAYATIGEISDAMRKVYGDFRSDVM